MCASVGGGREVSNLAHQPWLLAFISFAKLRGVHREESAALHEIYLGKQLAKQVDASASSCSSSLPSSENLRASVQDLLKRGASFSSALYSRGGFITRRVGRLQPPTRFSLRCRPFCLLFQHTQTPPPLREASIFQVRRFPLIHHPPPPCLHLEHLCFWCLKDGRGGGLHTGKLQVLVGKG